MAKVGMRTKAKYSFTEFLRPGGYWPSPYSIEQAFGVFGWMIETGQPFKRQGRWGMHTIECLLSKKSTCTGSYTIDRIASVDDLRERFWHAFFDNYSPIGQQWRKAVGIDAYGSKIIAFRHYGLNEAACCEGNLRSGIDALLGASGKLVTQLNRFHADADNIEGVELTYCSHDHGWTFRLMYGVDGSRWYHNLAHQKKGEPFTETFLRARKSLQSLTAEKGGDSC